MKTFQNLISAAIALCALSAASAAAVSDSSAAVSSSIITALSASSAPGTSASPSSTSTDTDTGLPTSTGGYVVAGVYTTCLTLTFAAPTSISLNPGGPIIGSASATNTPVSSGVNPGGPISSVSSASSVPVPSSINPGGSIQSAPPVSASASAFPSGINPGGPIIPVPSEVFTTCLVFLPSATATVTATTLTPCASASVSVVGSAPVASASLSLAANYNVLGVEGMDGHSFHTIPAITAGKVLVSGANGYIAVWVARTLLEHGFSVRSVVRSAGKGEHLTQLFSLYGANFELIIVPDITAEGAFDEAGEGLDAIEHTASLAHFQADDPAEMLVPAIKGTVGVLESARKYGCTFIYLDGVSRPF
ncbi:hypothetical protein K438DRAFT_1943005 [Mycena galopus ATCC 62051]|nr:hypothetical protein K438DRAFT_1943005 [Mycena galopus ATCC 62051]